MPKIRDLGINVVPATMRPPEIGEGGGGKGGGGGGDCEGATHECPEATYKNMPCTPGTLTTCMPGTLRPDNAGYVTNCLPGTLRPDNAGYAQGYGCTPGTLHNSPNCYAHAADYATCWLLSLIHCTPGTLRYEADDCTPCTRVTNVTPQIVHLTAAQTNQAAGSGLAREAIELLKKQLHEAIAQLDEVAKNLKREE